MGYGLCNKKIYTNPIAEQGEKKMAKKKTKDMKKTEKTGEFSRNIKIKYDPENERQVELGDGPHRLDSLNR